MSAIGRGTKNAFRNPLRTSSVIVILGISLGLVVVMLAARSAVNGRITEVKTSIGNTVSISPAGARGFLGGGEPLTSAQLATVQKVANVQSVTATVDAQLVIGTDTNLKSAVDAGTLGARQGRVFRGAVRIGGRTQTNTNEPVDFTPPILATGTNNATNAGSTVGSSLKISSGAAFDANGNENVAMMGTTLADKNSLKVGSTFTAYNTTITVAAIYDAGNEFANNSIVFPLATLQRLSSQTNEVTSMTATIDNSDHLAAATTAIQTSLGSAADVTSSVDTVTEAVKPLENIRTIATTSLYGALVAATIITLLTMVMIIRERRKEIAVLKAIGAGDGTIMTQFMTESVTLSLGGGILGIILGYIFSTPIINALVAAGNSSGNNPTVTTGGPGFSGGAVRIAAGGFRAFRGAVENLHAIISWEVLLGGLGAAILVAMIGSAFPAWIISRIRQAEVLRND